MLGVGCMEINNGNGKLKENLQSFPFLFFLKYQLDWKVGRDWKLF